VQTFWDQLLHSPLEIVSKAEQKPYTIYSPFWKNWVAQPKANPYPALEAATGLTSAEETIAQQTGAIALPSLKDLGFVWQGGQVLKPGEIAAQQQLAAFADRSLTRYDTDRNFPAQPGTSTLSPALKFGAIGIRNLWQVTQTALETALETTHSDEAKNGITTWQQELAWREFYQHVLYHFPELAEGAYRAPFKQFPWETNEAHFQAWQTGHTGYPIVDAAMRQLNQT
jgi:deoxyribodipyrimidine photo-lyase